MPEQQQNIDSNSNSSNDSSKHSKTASTLRNNLNISQQEAAASATMSGIIDNFLGAFAIFLNASAAQIGLLTGLPQIVGAVFQLVSVWAGFYLKRMRMIILGASMQVIIVGGIACLAFFPNNHKAVWVLVALAVVYHSASHFIQPQWRALMGDLVPPRIRGRYFARRTLINMSAALLAFFCGGYLLNVFQGFEASATGFFILFLIAMIGRFVSTQLLRKHPKLEIESSFENIEAFSRTWSQLKAALGDKSFREFTIYLALFNGAVAISAPFFAVYMLRDLSYSYLEFTFNVGASIFMQCLMLSSWGKISDQMGNRVVMLFTGSLIPFLPLLWLFSTNYAYLFFLQLLSGFLWSGFSLSTSNFLYDFRPHRTHFSTYAAVNACIVAIAVFAGSLLGGFIASSEFSTQWLDLVLQKVNVSTIFWVFLTSTSLRICVLLWYWPKAQEMRLQRRPELRELVFRIARFNNGAGPILDWFNVAQRKGFSPRKRVTLPSESEEQSRNPEKSNAKTLDAGSGPA